MLFAAMQRSTGFSIGEVWGDGGDDPGPLAIAPGPLIQDVQALQAADRGRPKPVGAGEVEGVAQIGLLDSQHGDDLGCAALSNFVMVGVAKSANGFAVGAAGAVGGHGVWTSVGGDVEGGEVPGQGGVDLVVAAAERGEQADAGGPVQQRDSGVAVQPGQLWHRIIPDCLLDTHVAEGVGVGGVAEQVQHRQPGPLGIGERLLEPVTERGGQRPGPA